MNRSQILKLLAEHKQILAQRFGFVRLALFGSVVRDAAKEDSEGNRGRTTVFSDK